MKPSLALMVCGFALQAQAPQPPNLTISGVNSRTKSSELTKDNWIANFGVSPHLANRLSPEGKVKFRIQDQNGNDLTPVGGRKGANLLSCCVRRSGGGYEVDMRPLLVPTTEITLILIDVPDAEGSLKHTEKLKDPTGNLETEAAKAANRDDAKIWIKAEALRAAGRDAELSTGDGRDRHYVSVDMLLQPKLAVTCAPGSTGRWCRFRRGGWLSPVFDLKVSTVPKADPGTLSTGLGFEKGIAPQWRMYQSGKLNFDKSFTQSEAVYDGRLLWMVPGKRPFTLDLSFGLETGKNIDALLAEAKGKAILRPRMEAAVHATRKKVLGAERLIITGSYVRRQPLTKEVIVEENEDDELVIQSFSRAPRQYATIGTTLNYTKVWGVSFGYDHGQLPPAYRFVDHRLRFGFSYKLGQ